MNPFEIAKTYIGLKEVFPRKVIEDGKVENTFWVKDIEKNITIWKDITLTEIQKQLFVLSYLRAQTSRLQFKILTLIRKATISTSKGFVNGENVNINNLL